MRVAEVVLVVLLVAGDGDFIGVDDHHVAAHVHRRVVGGHVLATDHLGSQGGQAPKSLRGYE